MFECDWQCCVCVCLLGRGGASARDRSVLFDFCIYLLNLLLSHTRLLPLSMITMSISRAVPTPVPLFTCLNRCNSRSILSILLLGSSLAHSSPPLPSSIHDSLVCSLTRNKTSQAAIRVLVKPSPGAQCSARVPGWRLQTSRKASTICNYHYRYHYRYHYHIHHTICNYFYSCLWLSKIVQPATTLYGTTQSTPHYRWPRFRLRRSSTCSHDYDLR